MKIVDANMILRYLLNDIPEQALIAAKIIKGDVITTPEIMAEVAYVLDGSYGINRDDISWYLHMALCDIGISDMNVMRYALGVYRSTKLDFVDCILIAYRKVRGIEFASFDRKLNNAADRAFDIYQPQAPEDLTDPDLS